MSPAAVSIPKSLKPFTFEGVGGGAYQRFDAFAGFPKLSADFSAQESSGSDDQNGFGLFHDVFGFG
jgi:hypothetical protein